MIQEYVETQEEVLQMSNLKFFKSSEIQKHEQFATTMVGLRQPFAGMKHTHDGFCSACDDYVTLAKHARQYPEHGEQTRTLTRNQAEAAEIDNLTRYG